MRAQILIVGCLVAGCSVENPWFGLAGQDGSTTAGTSTGTGVGPGSETLPTSQGPASTDASTTEAVTASTTGPLTATEADSTTSTDTGGSTGTSTGPEDTDAPVPDMGVGLCGNMIEETGEECDDGNSDPGDGCENNCRRMFRYEAFPVGAAPRDIAAVDVDGDGRTDLVVSHATAVMNEPDYSVLLNQGNGTFKLKAQALTGWTGATRVLVGQLDGDERPDLLLLGIAGNMQILTNASTPGSIKFTMKNVFQGQPPGPVPAATLADLDDNGGDDLLLVGTDSLHVYLNKEGMFAPGAKYGLELKLPNGVVAGAVIKADATPHVVVAHGAVMGEDRSLLLNMAGALKLQPEKGKLCPDGVSSLNIGDADNSGPLDVVAGCASGRITLAGTDMVKPYVRVVDTGVAAINSVGIVDLYGDVDAPEVYGTSTVTKSLVVGVAEGKLFVAIHVEKLEGSPGASVAARIDDDDAPDIAVVLPVAGTVGVFFNQTRM